MLETEAWQCSGIRSASHWVAWQCGVSPARARRLVLMARRRGELPETRAALEAGELGEDQVAVVCRHAPAAVDAEAAELARYATVAQLQRVLGSYPFHDEAKADPTAPTARERPAAPRRVSFGHSERGTWRLSAELPPDEGALVERALVAARDELFHAGEHEDSTRPVPGDVDWADAFVTLAERSLGGAQRPHRDRNLVLLHVGTDPEGTTNGRPVLPGQLLEAAAERLGIPEGRWSHPTGEPLDAGWVSFNEPAVAVLGS